MNIFSRNAYSRFYLMGFLGVLVLWWIGSTTAVQAAPNATLTVTSMADSGAGSLRNQVAAANSGDTIIFSASLSGQTINLTSGQILIDKSLTIDGSALVNKITINGSSNSARMFYVDVPGGNVTFRGLRFINGDSNTGDPGDKDGDGGAIYGLSTSNLIITESVFENNQSEFNGGAVYVGVQAGLAQISNNRFTSNSTQYVGGAVRTVSDQATLIAGNTFVTNSANEGGAVWSSGNAPTTVVNNTFSDSTGNAVYLYTTLNLTNNTFLGGEAIFMRGGSAVLHMRNNILGGCSQLVGGVISTNVNNWVRYANNCGLSIAGDPLLMPLDDNGGFTPTAALVPFIGASSLTATSDCPATDQRGQIRGATCNIGAYEIKTSDHQISQCRTGLVQGETYAFGATGILITVDTLGSLTQLCVNLTESNHINATTGIQTGRYWTVTPTAATNNWSLTMSAPVDFTLDASDKLCRYTGTGIVWDCAMTSTNNSTQRITRTGISQLSPWAVGNDVGPTAVAYSSAAATSTTANRVWIGLLFGLLGLFTLVAHVTRTD